MALGLPCDGQFLPPPSPSLLVCHPVVVQELGKHPQTTEVGAPGRTVTLVPYQQSPEVAVNQPLGSPQKTLRMASVEWEESQMASDGRGLEVSWDQAQPQSHFLH